MSRSPEQPLLSCITHWGRAQAGPEKHPGTGTWGHKLVRQIQWRWGCLSRGWVRPRKCSCWRLVLLLPPPRVSASWIFLSYEECSFSVSFAKSDLTVACFLVHYIFVTVQQPMVEDKAPHMCAVLHRRPRPSAVPFGSSSKPQVTGISPICQMIRSKFKIERMLAF